VLLARQIKNLREKESENNKCITRFINDV
jgi:hypothetical protein